MADSSTADLGKGKRITGGDRSTLADELRKLQDAIAQNPHGTIADSLSTLSELTKVAAVKATPDSQSRLYQLSDVLKQTAGQVGF